MTGKSNLQRRIITEHKENSSQRDEEIAVKLDCSSSYVNRTRNEYEDQRSSDGNLWFWIIVIVGVLLFLAENGVI